MAAQKESNVVLALLGILVFASLTVIAAAGQTVSSGYADAWSGRLIRQDIATLEAAYAVLNVELRDALADLRQTTGSVSGVVSPYIDPPFHAEFSTTAAKSPTIRGLAYYEPTSIPWFFRNIGFCYGSLYNKPFHEVTINEIMWTGYLLRLTEEEASAVDDDINELWRSRGLHPRLRGNPNAFATFARLARARISSTLLNLSDVQYAAMITRLRAASTNRAGETRDSGETPMRVVMSAALSPQSPFSDATDTPTVNLRVVEMKVASVLLFFPLIAAPLTFVSFALWRQRQTRHRPDTRSAPLKFTELVGLGEHHPTFDRLVLTTILSLVVLAHLLLIAADAVVAMEEPLYGFHLLLVLLSLTLCAITWRGTKSFPWMPNGFRNLMQ